jgi:acetyl-CoA carboxylase biotin carboxyl carrier protein
MPPQRGADQGARKPKNPKAKSAEEIAVAEETPQNPRPFDVAVVRALVGLMSRHDLSEIDLCEGDQRIRLRRGAKTVTVAGPAVALPQAALPAPSPAAAPAAPAAESAPAKPAKQLQEIKSQLVGTFYASPKPGSPAFVKIGDRVSPTTVVGIIEAMKIFNEITAECSGVITEICVDNQQPVEYEQVLFRVDPSA